MAQIAHASLLDLLDAELQADSVSSEFTAADKVTDYMRQPNN